MNDFDILGTHICKIGNLVDNWIALQGLTYNHFAILYTLAKASEGSCTQKQICKECLIPKQTVFNICKEFRQEGLIEFYESPEDKRERIIKLTEQGYAKSKPLYENTKLFWEKVFINFSPQKTKNLFDLMAELTNICQNELNNSYKQNNDKPK